jgi:hypothetical protein
MGSTQKFIVRPSNVYLIEIIRPIGYLPLDKYTQYASKGPGERFYIDKGAAGRKSIGAKSVRVLAQCIIYFPNQN